MRKVLSGYSHGRRGSSLIIVCLLIIVAIFFVTKVMLKQNEQKVVRDLSNSQLDPEQSMERFLQERSRTHELGEKEWRDSLLDFMSLEDKGWFDRNYTALAAWSEKNGSGSPQTEEEKQFVALKDLLKVGQGTRPLLVQIAVKDNLGVAYIQDPGNLQSMREVFMISEAGLWKVRRFMGVRDSPEVMAWLVKDKQAKGTALDAEEEQYVANPQGYAAQKRAELLREAGIVPSTGAPR